MSRFVLDQFAWPSPTRRRIQLTEAYERLQPYVFLELLARTRARTVLDIGANVGQYSLLSTLAASVDRVHAFEIDEVALTMLAASIDANGVGQRVTIHPVAVSSSARQLTFGVASPMGGNNGVVETSIHDPAVYKHLRTVGATTIDSLEDVAGPVGIKLDVEGHEVDVINGARSLLGATDGFMQVEIYDDAGPITDALVQSGWNALFRVGPDHYFGKGKELMHPFIWKVVLESAISAEISDRLRPSPGATFKTRLRRWSSWSR